MIRVSGEPSTLLSLSGAVLTLRVGAPSPPGARLEVVLDLDGTAHSFRLKVHGCRREAGEPAAFVLHGAWMDLRREARLALEAHAAAIRPQGT